MNFTTKRNDTRAAIKATLKNTDGTPVNLTGATVQFIMARSNGVVLINRQAVVQDAPNGMVWFVFEPGETAEAGTFRAEFQVTYLDGRIETFPNIGYITVSILNDLG